MVWKVDFFRYCNMLFALFDSDAEGGEARAGGGRGRTGGTRRGVSFANHILGRQPQPAYQLPPARPRLWRHAAAPDPAWGADRTAENVWSKSPLVCWFNNIAAL